MAKDGDRWTDSDGTTHTVNSADDKKAAGGYYYTQVDKNGNKATAVYNSDGTFAPVKANNDWKEVPRQD